MNLKNISLRLSFFVCLLLTILCPAFLPHCKLLFFAPFMIIAIYQKPLFKVLWIALLCGLVVDLFDSHQRLPLHALAFVATASLLYRQRRHFFADTLSTLPIMTFLFSLLFTAINFLLVNVYVGRLNVSLEWMLTDLIVLPAADAVFAMVFFQLPLLIIGKRPMQGKDYFMD